MTFSFPAPLRCGTALVLALLSTQTGADAQTTQVNPVDKFKQLEEILPTPNDYRTASGAPGYRYWQQRADYVIDVELDEVNRRITGRETISYRNNSPETLTYLWLQLDQNIFRKDSDAALTQTAPSFTGVGGRGSGGGAVDGGGRHAPGRACRTTASRACSRRWRSTAATTSRRSPTRRAPPSPTPSSRR